MSDRFAGRSIHGAPQHARKFAEHARLLIDGAVERPIEITLDNLDGSNRRSFLAAFTADERPFWPGTDWSGVPLSTLATLARPLDQVRWIQVLGGPLASVLPIEMADRALLCDRRGGEPIPLENGGPYRLVCPEINYNLCVKWVDHIVLCVDEPDRSVERIAVARQRARDARH